MIYKKSPEIQPARACPDPINLLQTGIINWNRPKLSIK